MAPRKGKLRDLRTEQQNSASAGLDTLSALEIARVINHEDHKVAAAVERALPQIAQAIDAIADAIRSGGRLIYVGAGTSGRLAALDAAECPPTFNTDPKTVQYVIAGGDKALGHAAEYSEDSGSSGRKDIAKRKPGKERCGSGSCCQWSDALHPGRSGTCTQEKGQNRRGGLQSWLPDGRSGRY